MNVILGISTLASSSLITHGILSVDLLNLHCGFWWGFHVSEKKCCSIQECRDFLWVWESTFSSHHYFCTSCRRVYVMRYYNEGGFRVGVWYARIRYCLQRIMNYYIRGATLQMHLDAENSEGHSERQTEWGSVKNHIRNTALVAFSLLYKCLCATGFSKTSQQESGTRYIPTHSHPSTSDTEVLSRPWASYLDQKGILWHPFL